LRRTSAMSLGRDALIEGRRLAQEPGGRNPAGPAWIVALGLGCTARPRFTTEQAGEAYRGAPLQVVRGTQGSASGAADVQEPLVLPSGLCACRASTSRSLISGRRNSAVLVVESGPVRVWWQRTAADPVRLF